MDKPLKDYEFYATRAAAMRHLAEDVRSGKLREGCLQVAEELEAQAKLAAKKPSGGLAGQISRPGTKAISR